MEEIRQVGALYVTSYCRHFELTWAIAHPDLAEWKVAIYARDAGVGSGGFRGVIAPPPPFLEDQLTLFNQGADYAHHITTGRRRHCAPENYIIRSSMKIATGIIQIFKIFSSASNYQWLEIQSILYPSLQSLYLDNLFSLCHSTVNRQYFELT